MPGNVFVKIEKTLQGNLGDKRNIFEKLEDLLKGDDLLKGGDLLMDFKIFDKYSHTIIFSRKNQQAKRAVRDIIRILQEKN
ncbi:hypothetical protein LCGC14_0650990 [marine sediment metagenome]|uniref:Uncharacterized protein n=1 Tax=marine sediment metagenome TaxID=412755 RepID=A0A0F9QW64_9ZZZZ